MRHSCYQAIQYHWIWQLRLKYNRIWELAGLLSILFNTNFLQSMFGELKQKWDSEKTRKSQFADVAKTSDSFWKNKLKALTCRSDTYASYLYLQRYRYLHHWNTTWNMSISSCLCYIKKKWSFIYGVFSPALFNQPTKTNPILSCIHLFGKLIDLVFMFVLTCHRLSWVFTFSGEEKKILYNVLYKENLKFQKAE